MSHECKHGRLTGRCTECVSESKAEQLEAANCLLRKELEIHKERGDRMRDLAMYAYHRSSEALMMPPSRPREARQAREQAICDINKKIGGAVR